jgi:hypothetical protein
MHVVSFFLHVVVLNVLVSQMLVQILIELLMLMQHELVSYINNKKKRNVLKRNKYLNTIHLKSLFYV